MSSVRKLFFGGGLLAIFSSGGLFFVGAWFMFVIAYSHWLLVGLILVLLYFGFLLRVRVRDRRFDRKWKKTSRARRGPTDPVLTTSRNIGEYPADLPPYVDMNER